MISKVLKYSPTFQQCNLFLYSAYTNNRFNDSNNSGYNPQNRKFNRNPHDLFLEKRIAECRFTSDLMFVFSQEENMTPAILHQYCYKLNNFYNIELPANNIISFIKEIKKVDLSEASVEELSSYAAIAFSSAQANIPDWRLLKAIYNKSKDFVRTSKNKESDLEVESESENKVVLSIYSLINFYKLATLFESRIYINKIVDRLEAGIESDGLQLKDYQSILKILASRYFLSIREKNLCLKIIAKVSEIEKQAEIKINPKIKFYSSLRKLNFPGEKNQSVTGLLFSFQDYLKERIGEMNENNINTVLNDLPSSDIIYRMIFDQLIDSIEQETGQCDINSKLAIKFFKIISQKRSIKRISREKFDKKILKLFEKSLQDNNGQNYQFDILQMIRNGFFSRYQITKIQEIFQKNSVYQVNREYIYECLAVNIKFDNYDAFSENFEKSQVNLQNKEFITQALLAQKLKQTAPDNAIFLEKYNQVIQLIKEKLPQNLSVVRFWKNTRQERAEDFLQTFGDSFLPTILNSTQQQGYKLNRQLFLFLFQGNEHRSLIKHLQDTKTTIPPQLISQLINVVLNKPIKAANRIQFINKIILGQIDILLESISNQIQADKQNRQKKNRGEQLQPNKSLYNQPERLLFSKILRYLIDPEINELIDANEAGYFINLAIKIIKKFPNQSDSLYYDEFLITFISNLKEINKNNSEYMKFLKTIQEQKQKIQNIPILIKICWQLKKFGAFDSQFANFAAEKSIKNQKLNKYITAVAGKDITLDQTLVVSFDALPIIVYLSTHHSSVNQKYLSENLSNILSTIDTVSTPAILAESIFNISLTNSLTSNSQQYKIINKILEKLSQLMHTSNFVFSYNPLKFYQIFEITSKLFLYNSEYRLFLQNVCKYSCSHISDLGFHTHHLILAECFKLNYRNQQYNEKIVEEIRQHIKSSRVVSKKKIQMMTDISASQVLTPKQSYLYWSIGAMKYNTHLLLRYVKNSLVNHDGKTIAMLKRLLETIKSQPDRTIFLHYSRYFDLKSDNKLTQLLSSIPTTQYKNSRITGLYNIIQNHCNEKNIPNQSISQAGLKLLKIKQKYIYFSVQKLLHDNYQVEKDFIKTIFNDKIDKPLTQDNENIIVLLVRKVNYKNIIKLLNQNIEGFTENEEDINILIQKCKNIKDTKQKLEESDQSDDEDIVDKK